jgi:hypothetical protein
LDLDGELGAVFPLRNDLLSAVHRAAGWRRLVELPVLPVNAPQSLRNRNSTPLPINSPRL